MAVTFLLESGMCGRVTRWWERYIVDCICSGFRIQMHLKYSCVCYGNKKNKILASTSRVHRTLLFTRKIPLIPRSKSFNQTFGSFSFSFILWRLNTLRDSSSLCHLLIIPLSASSVAVAFVFVVIIISSPYFAVAFANGWFESLTAFRVMYFVYDVKQKQKKSKNGGFSHFV